MTNEAEALPHRTQAQRRAETRGLLLNAARELFLSKGYDQTGMPEIVKKVGLTRGALYHHFDSKADLFKAVAETEAQSIGHAIGLATKDVADPDEAMAVGTNAYFDAMAAPGRAEILLVLAPAIMGPEAAEKLTASEGRAELRAGLSQAMPKLKAAELDALTDILSAAYDRAALQIAEGGNKDTYTAALSLVVRKLLAA
ncbi:TetR/AcrR family transcriptional regulator [Aliiroseovarius sp. S1339]|uniref:TetR/AcrR family transcriptional regulator n=1 Tax=Aliiroseovarius sp. S1339 TaxID=2936990 RepID=UPI0020BF8A7B|nr:TetR/AcrR family transcriptional regulator [Aliiroseovarius sp. S1339]MCK8463796.1 TetR/AcrR family transcriptional regulator [Aliiroseovarius sp. S1339]